MQPTTAPEPFKWGLFNHNPALSMHATDRNAPVFATCTCGWTSPKVPRHRMAEAVEAEQEHMRELRKAIDAWRAEDAAERPPRETLAENVARLYPDGASAGLVPVRLVPVEVFGSNCDCHEDRELAADGTDCVGFSYGLSDAVSAWSDCNRAVGRIYRRDEDESPRDQGGTILVWVAPEQVALFNVVFGER